MSDEERRQDPALDGLTPSEMLASNGVQALRRIAEILSLPINPEDLQSTRLVLDAARQTLQSLIHAQEASLATRRDPNRAPSQRLLAAAARADELCRKRDEEKAAMEAARLAAQSASE